MSPYIYVKEAHRYYDPIERRYYMIGDTAGNRVLTKNIYFQVQSHWVNNVDKGVADVKRYQW